MNTKTNTPILTSREAYAAFTARWKSLARARALTSADMLLRAIVLGQDPERALPLPTNGVKLANGALAGCGLARARRLLATRTPQQALRLKCEAILRYQRTYGALLPLPDWLDAPLWFEKWSDITLPAGAPHPLTPAHIDAIWRRAHELEVSA